MKKWAWFLIAMMVAGLLSIGACPEPREEERGEILNFLKYSGIADIFDSLNEFSEDWEAFTNSLETVTDSTRIIDKLNDFHARAEENYLNYYGTNVNIPRRLSSAMDKGMEAAEIPRPVVTKYLEAYQTPGTGQAISLMHEGDQLMSQSNTLRMEAWGEIAQIAKEYGIDFK